MKKIFSLVAALVAALSLSATVYTPAPGENAIKTIFDGGLEDGDTIVLSTGTYIEWQSMDFTTKLTIIAAPDAKPILKWYSIKMKNDFEVNGVEMQNVSNDNYLIRTGANVTGKIAVKNCKLDNQAPTPFIYLSANTVGTLEIDNCIFTGTTKNEGGLIYGAGATVGNFIMTNSTVYNIPGDLAIYMANCTTSASVTYCTFYNCGTRAIYIGGTTAPTSCVVENCIVVAPEVPSSNNYCIATYAGEVNNCMYYNLKAPRSSNASVTDCENDDPLFKDAANADFTLTEESPAITAGTDGGAIGDPRWTKDIPTAVENTAIRTKAVKRFVNGQMVIERNGRLYNATGAEL